MLDAVCFALYGEVPGDRSSAKRLRCDHAPPGSAPRVVLEVTLGDRRFRSDPLPRVAAAEEAGHRHAPPQQATVLVEESVDGEWLNT